MEDMLNEIDTADRIANQDIRIDREVIHFKAVVKHHRVELRNAEAEQQELVQQRADAKASIESQLSDRRSLVESIRSEIVQMKAEERRRQEELAREAAAARVAEQQQSAQAALGNPYATSSTPTVHVPPSSIGTTVVAIAERYLGIPYVYAGASPSGGFDCSGLVMYVFAQVGISLPHYAASQYGYGMPVSQDQLEPGDLVFFDGLGHVGIYIGGGNFIHAPHTGDVVKISSLSESWYTENYVGARRIQQLVGANSAEVDARVVGVQRGDLHHVPGVRGMDELVVPDVDPDVSGYAALVVEEDEITRGQCPTRHGRALVDLVARPVEQMDPQLLVHVHGQPGAVEAGYRIGAGVHVRDSEVAHPRSRRRARRYSRRA